MRPRRRSVFILIDARDPYELPLAVADSVKELASLAKVAEYQIYRSLREECTIRKGTRDYRAIRCWLNL